MTSSTSRERAPRFNRSERTLHWLHAAAFLGMLVTGVTLYAPDLAGTIGPRGSVKAAHILIAGTWIAALLVTVALGDRRGLGETRRELEQLDSDDLRWLMGRGAPQGRFNAGQKLHAVLQAACAVLFVVSGVLLLAGERNTDLRLDGTIALHDGLTIVATTLVLGHLYLALVHRSTRPALAGMVRGSVDARWAAERHAKWDRRPRTTAVASPSVAAQAVTLLLLIAAAAVAVLTVTQA